MMNKTNAALQESILPAVLALGYELLGCVCFNRGRQTIIRIYIDKEGGITIDDCERASYQINGVLAVSDLINDNYMLEVSSPGLDRPLFTPEQFRRFIGQRVRIRMHVPLQGQRQFTGLLQNVVDEKVVLLLAEGEVLLPFANIERANLAPDFNKAG
jgi:ribosome maturation factor RimP